VAVTVVSWSSAVVTGLAVVLGITIGVGVGVATCGLAITMPEVIIVVPMAGIV